MMLKDFCTTNVSTCGPQTTVLQAANLMRRLHVGDLVVVDEPQEQGIPLGVITDRDIVIEVVAKGLDPSKTTVASLMRTPVVMAYENEDATQVIERMKQHGVRRLPVVDREGETMGIVTLDDLLRIVVADASALLAIMAKGQANEHRARQ